MPDSTTGSRRWIVRVEQGKRSPAWAEATSARRVRDLMLVIVVVSEVFADGILEFHKGGGRERWMSHMDGSLITVISPKFGWRHESTPHAQMKLFANIFDILCQS